MFSISPKNGFSYSCLGDLQESSVPGEGSFLARCALKFSEVVAAGVATALSGYVVAHLVAPMFSATQPAGMQGPVEGPHRAANVSGATATLPQAASTDHSTPHGSSKPKAKLVEPTAAAPARPKVSPTKSKPVETRAAETLPGGAAARRSQDAAGRKPDTAESLEARVRAALARSNGRSALTDVPRRQLQVPSAVPNTVPSVEPRPPAAAVAAAPAEPAPGSLASVPRTAALPPQRIDIAPQPAAPPIPPNPASQMTVRQTPGQNPGGQTTVGQDPAGQNPAGQNPSGQNSPIQLPPLTTVVVKPQPSVGAESPQPAPAAADAQAPPEGQGRGLFSTFARMLRRSDKPLPEDQAPRPPNAVGQ
jgi:hypothetical protein